MSLLAIIIFFFTALSHGLKLSGFDIPACSRSNCDTLAQVLLVTHVKIFFFIIKPLLLKDFILVMNLFNLFLCCMVKFWLFFLTAFGCFC